VRRALVVAVVLAAATMAWPSSPALGCSATGPVPTEAEFLAGADVVFEGVAGAHRDPNAGAPVQGSGDPIFWTFTVDRQVKGAVAPVQEVGTARSDASCGIRFLEGVRYRVYAQYEGAALMTSAFSGTRVAPVTTSTTTRSTTTTSPPRRIALTG
jgi:hypothetical protein